MKKMSPLLIVLLALTMAAALLAGCGSSSKSSANSTSSQGSTAGITESPADIDGPRQPSPTGAEQGLFERRQHYGDRKRGRADG